MRQHLTRAFLKYQELGRYLSWLEEGLDKSCRLVNLFAGKRIPDLTPLSIPEPYRSLLLSTLELQAVGSSVLTRGRHNLLDLARRIHGGALINPKAYQQVCDIKGPRTPQKELIGLLQEFDAWTYTLREHCRLLDHVLSKVRAGHYYEATHLAQRWNIGKLVGFVPGLHLRCLGYTGWWQELLEDERLERLFFQTL